MSKRISDLVIISDVDGTLIHHGESIPQRNFDALERFTKGGGRFGIATGRSLPYTSRLVARVPVNLPCVLLNGGAIYDFSADRFLVEQFLPKAAEDYLRQIHEAFPEIGLMIVNPDDYYDVNKEKNASQMSRAGVIRKFTSSVIDEVGAPWYKIIFLVSAEQGNALREYIARQAFRGVRFVYTSGVMYEMIPESSTKANALMKLMELEGISRENIIAIGDYYNDIDMIRMAGLGVTVPEAPEEVLAAADLVVGPCADGCLADLVEHLEQMYDY